MTVHVDNVSDLAKTNEGVAVALNRFTNWTCSKAVTEHPLVPDNLVSRLGDYTKISLKNSVALNYSHLAITLSPTISVGIPGSALVELINPNVHGTFQVVSGQTLSWSPGSGKPCLMIFSIHHQLDAKAKPFRVRVTNNGIPTDGCFARCHAYWGFDLSTRMRYYRCEPASRIDFEVGYQMSHLSSMKQVRQYVQYTFDSSRSDRRPQLCSKSSMSVIPEVDQSYSRSVSAPADRVGMQVGSSDTTSRNEKPRVLPSETNKLGKVDHRKRSKSPLSMTERSHSVHENFAIPIKRNTDGKVLVDHNTDSPSKGGINSGLSGEVQHYDQ
nr:movement protein [Tombusviridae sp.]